MKKILAMIALLLVAAMLFSACNSDADLDDEETEDTEEENEEEDKKETSKKETSKKETSKKETSKKETSKKETSEKETDEETDEEIDDTEVTDETDETDNIEETEETEETDSTEATDKTDDTDEGEGTDDMNTNEPVLKDTYKKSVKILAIGNSFSDDAMEHLAIILKDAGVEEIVLGNLYIGGCSIDTHFEKMMSLAKDYDFRINTGSGWSSTKQDIQTGILYTDWDVITVQQASNYSGLIDSYSKLETLVELVRGTAINEDVKVLWHMTWAYQSDSTHGGFANYNKNQMTMYNAITSVVNNKIIPADYIDGLIPSGTAIQNLRTSYLGDTLTRDGFHLSLGIGRYTAGLMWFKQLTGADISDIDAIPTSYPEIAKHLPAIKEAVNKAFEENLSVNDVTVANPDKDLWEMNDNDKAYLTNLGYDPDEFAVLDLGLKMKAYYNSTHTEGFASPVYGVDNSYLFIATSIFSPTDIPVGSVVNITDGYRYRLEGWQKLSEKNALERLETSTEDFVVSDSLYAKYNFLAFNISRVDGSGIIDDDKWALRIYVPIEEESTALTSADREYLTSIGKNPDQYEKVVLDYSLFAYYNQSSNIVSSKNTTASNLVNFISTGVLSKSDIPNGSVIRIDKGYQYRPEGWQALGTALVGTRPDNVVGTNDINYIVTDDAWWGDYNYRGFNVAVQGANAVVSLETGTHFVIYAYKG